MKNSFKIIPSGFELLRGSPKPSITTLDVNEQNTQALGFCEKLDFVLLDVLRKRWKGKIILYCI